MSAAPELEGVVVAPSPAPPPPVLARAVAPAPPARRLALRLTDEWLPVAAWSLGRTGWPGLVGLGLLVAAALFFFSTHLEVRSEVEALRADVASAQRGARPGTTEEAPDPMGTVRALPGRADVPAVLHQLFEQATRAGLAVDTARYEVSATKGSSLVRYKIAFPVTGPYPEIRGFIDATLATMPAVALSDLAIERKTIAQGSVEAQIKLTVHALAGDAGGRRRDTPAAADAADRVIAPTYAGALFAPHSWYVRPPPKPAPPPPPEPPPPEPTAPALPFAFLGSFAPEGDAPVFFLSRGDRVIDARVGDRIDGVYQLESAGGGRLVFVYLPLNVRQNLAAGAVTGVSR